MSKFTLSATITLALGTMFIAGCATKNYVKKSITPVDQKVDQVDQASQKRDSSQVADINKTNQALDDTDKKLSATDEIAKTADGTAKGAMAKGNQNSKEINDLRGVIANIDDYKPAGDATVVHFAVNKYILTKDEKAKLDAMATQLGSQQRYFITVEGFTDQTGTAAINDQLSRSRADAVISYLVGSHDVPVYRIHMVGLGSQKLVDEGKGRKAREASRRVEVTLFTAKPLTMSAAGGN
ncbi:MAG TPA: OmpA family protein [Candidatus Saccharimonadales bacterium]|jgi:OOP family OmpA-OmpF porin|nr:OmpA family protein [Candidatus Saccharimonadales bacterium]